MTIHFKNGSKLEVEARIVNIICENLNKYPEMKFSSFKPAEDSDINLVINTNEILYIQ